MHWLYVLWFGYGWASIKGNGGEALVQTAVYAAIGVAIWPPARKAIERFAKRHTAELHAKLDRHEALMQHVIRHSTDIPPFQEEREMTTYKLGKLAATRPEGLRDLAEYATAPLPAPPASCNFYKGLSLPIDGNDEYGDCVMAATAHLIRAWDTEEHEKDKVPASGAVVTEYFKLTGGQDTGLNESNVLQTWHQQGLFGHKIAAYAPVPHTDVEAIQQAIAFYGGALFGIECPDSAQTQFANGEPWTVVHGATIEGGHAIAPLGYDAQYVYCATWGGIAPVSYAFLKKYLDEVWCVIPSQFVEAGKGPSLDLAALKADLAAL